MKDQLKELKGKKTRVCGEGVETEDYVRVKARRGEATDGHSLAERARRAQIRMRMKLLQSLVPGCDKIIGEAYILDEIIIYVKLLQNQVEALASKLAFVDLMLCECEQNPSGYASVSEVLSQEELLSSVPESSSVPFMSLKDSAPSYSASLLLTQDQKTTLIPQYGRDLLLDVEDQPEAIKTTDCSPCKSEIFQ